jgi:hypothetical protein
MTKDRATTLPVASDLLKELETDPELPGGAGYFARPAGAPSRSRRSSTAVCEYGIENGAGSVFAIRFAAFLGSPARKRHGWATKGQDGAITPCGISITACGFSIPRQLCYHRLQRGSVAFFGSLQSSSLVFSSGSGSGVISYLISASAEYLR